MKSKADVVSNIALVVAIISLLSAGAFLLIVIKTDEVSKLLMNVPYLLASAGLFFSIISLLFEWKARKEAIRLRKMRTKSDDKKSWLMPGLQEQRVDRRKKDRITSIKNSSKKKKLENPDLSGFFSSYVGGIEYYSNVYDW